MSALCGENNEFPLFFPPRTSNHLQLLGLSLFGLTKRLLIRVNRMDALNILRQQVTRVACPFLSASLNVMKSFRNAVIDVALDEDHLCCRVSLVLLAAF
jgi:hypothetical protein